MLSPDIPVFCIGQYEFLWTLEIYLHLSLKASVNIVLKVHKNSYHGQRVALLHVQVLFNIEFIYLHAELVGNP
jgi:hypothetical protein